MLATLSPTPGQVPRGGTAGSNSIHILKGFFINKYCHTRKWTSGKLFYFYISKRNVSAHSSNSLISNKYYPFPILIWQFNKHKIVLYFFFHLLTSKEIKPFLYAYQPVLLPSFVTCLIMSFVQFLWKVEQIGINSVCIKDIKPVYHILLTFPYSIFAICTFQH